MNRLSVHSLFFLAAIAFASFAIWQFQSIVAQNKQSRALAEIPSTATADDPMPAVANTSDQSRLAWANALSAGGALSEAENLYGNLTNQSTDPDIGNAAEYNLGNAYLREASTAQLSGNRKRAILGLAKQRYRDLLQRAPDDWDARYNLERALRLAPEIAGLRESKGPPIKSVDVVVPDFMLKALP